MSQLTKEALMFEGRVEEVVQAIRLEVSEREQPRQLHSLNDLRESYQLLPEELKGMIGYNPKSFYEDLDRLMQIYTSHIEKKCWTKLMLALESLHSKERTEVMVAAAMFSDQQEPVEETWLQRAKKRLF